MDNQQQVKALTDRLEQGIKSIFEDTSYQDYLRTMSHFHRYSARNSLLIHLQRPDATYVAGFNSWKTDFGRSVNKGEKGIQIFAPAPIKRIQQMQSRDDQGAPIFDNEGKPVTTPHEVTIPTFKAVYVFDVSQTSGKDLPEYSHGPNVLNGEVENYSPFFEALRRVSPMPIEFEKMERGKQGYTNYIEQRIALDDNQSQAQNVVVALHEITHARLHSDRTIGSARSKREIEAASVAFVVSAHYGIQSDATSFDYIAGWSREKTLAELKQSLDIIQKEAFQLINDIDHQLEEISKEAVLSAESLTPAGVKPIITDGGIYAEQLIDQYEKYGNNQYRSVFGQDEKSLIVNYAMHEPDRTKVDALASDLAREGFELKHFYANPDTVKRINTEIYGDLAFAEQVIDSPEQITPAAAPLYLGNGKYAELLIDQHEQFGTPEWHSVFGNDEKNLLTDYAVHEADREKIDALAAELAADRFELNHGYANPDTVDRVNRAIDDLAATVPDMNEIAEQPHVENGKFAENLIDQYEQYDTPEWHLVFGGGEKNLLINYAMHQEDRDKISALANVMAEQKFELVNGFVNPIVREPIEAFCNDLDSIRNDSILSVGKFDRAFVPTIEFVLKSNTGYGVYDENGHFVNILDPDPDYFKITSIDLDSGERTVVGFSRTREYTFDADDYRNCLFENETIGANTQNIHFEGHSGLWRVADDAYLHDSKYYLVVKQDEPTNFMVVNENGAVIIPDDLKDSLNPHNDFINNLTDYVAQERMKQAIGENQFTAETFERHFGEADEQGYYQIVNYEEYNEKSVIVGYNPNNQEKPFHVLADMHEMEVESDVMRHYESFPPDMDRLFSNYPYINQQHVQDVVDGNYFSTMESCAELPLESLRSTAQESTASYGGRSGEGMSHSAKLESIPQNTVIVDMRRSEYNHHTKVVPKRSTSTQQRSQTSLREKLANARKDLDTRKSAAPTLPTTEISKKNAFER